MTTKAPSSLDQKTRYRRFVFLGLLLFCLSVVSCGPNESVLKSGKETPAGPPMTPVPDTFERDIAAMNQVGFTWVYVVRRKDGGKMDADDKSFIRANTADANRHVLSDGDKAVLIGTNYMVSEQNLKALKDRFDFSDMSTAPEGAPAPVTKQ